MLCRRVSCKPTLGEDPNADAFDETNYQGPAFASTMSVMVVQMESFQDGHI